MNHLTYLISPVISTIAPLNTKESFLMYGGSLNPIFDRIVSNLLILFLTVWAVSISWNCNKNNKDIFQRIFYAVCAGTFSIFYLLIRYLFIGTCN
jgi:hypothetical protein